MSNLMAGVIGAGAGLVVALLGNLIALPIALRHQQRLPDSYRAPVVGWNKQRMGRFTTLMYRFQMPILFAGVGAVLAIDLLGGSQ